MSLVGHVDWYFQVIVCARETCGMAIVAAPAVPAASRNLRRDVRELPDVMRVDLSRQHGPRMMCLADGRSGDFYTAEFETREAGDRILVDEGLLLESRGLRHGYTQPPYR